MFNALDLAAEHLRHRQRAVAGDQHEQDQPHDLAAVHRAVLDGRRHLAHARGLPAQHRPDVAVGRRSTRRRRSAARSSFGVPITETDTINFGFRVEHTNLTLFANSPPLYYRVRQRVRLRRPTATSLSAGWSRDTRDDILYPTSRPAAERRWSRSGCRSATSRTTSCNYLNQSFWPVYGDFVLMLRGDLGYGDGYGGKPLPFFKAFYAGGVGSVRGYETELARPARHLRQRARRQAQDRRQRRALLSDPEGRQVGARQRVLRRRARSTSNGIAARVRERSATRPASASRGIRRSARSSSATRIPLNDEARRQDPALPVPGRHGVLTRAQEHRRRTA